MVKYMKYIIFTDGGSRGNPGPAAVGVVVENEKGEALKEYSQYLGETTNNEAEYQAVIFGLKKIKALFGKEKIKNISLEVRLDSELVAQQINHQYKIKEENLFPLFIKIWNTLIDFGPVNFVCVPREQNKRADRLVNEALDSQQNSKSLPGLD